MDESNKAPLRTLLGWGGTAAVLLIMDLIWLGVVARPLYAELLGPMLREPANWVAALIFYFFYVTVCWAYAVRGAPGVGAAAKKGAALGFVCYTVYELTNWAVIAGWPAALVPIDVAWGVVLTGAAAAGGAFAGAQRGPTQ